MSSSTSKRRKVTVDIKQTKLVRESVFERLGNQEKRKKWKEGTEGKIKSKKSSSKVEDESEQKKKTKVAKSEQNVSTKKSKEYPSTSKAKSSHDDGKESRKSHKHYEEAEMVVTSETGRSHSKHKSDRDGKLQKIDNLIIEKRVSRSSSYDQSRSVSPSYSPKKKSKKRPLKQPSQERTLEQYQRNQSLSPDPHTESHRQKERGRSREPKKRSKDGIRKMKVEEAEKDVYVAKSSSKAKKASKHSKHEKGYEEEPMSEKKHKVKHGKEALVEKSKIKASPIVYEESSDERYRKTDHKSEERGKTKRRKYEDDSGDESPIRHKKSKRQPSVESENREYVSKTRSPSKLSKKRSHKDEAQAVKKHAQKQDSLQGTFSDFSSTSKQSIPEYSEISQESDVAIEERYSSDSYERETKKKTRTNKKKQKKDAESSKVRYEVIDADDGFSDDTKKVKKRKRKREDIESPYLESPPKVEERYHEKERRHEDTQREIAHSKKKVESRNWSPHDDVRRSEKYSNARHDAYERRSSHDRVQSSRMMKSDIRSPENKYYEPRKSSHDRRKDDYTEPVHSRDGRYSPDRRGYAKSDLDSRHLSDERSSDNKVAEWQRKSSKHFSTERKDTMHRHLPPPHIHDPRNDYSRPPDKYHSNRKLLEPGYTLPSESQDYHRGVRSYERPHRGHERSHLRPPPLIPPYFGRGRGRGTYAPRGRDRMMPGDRRSDRDLSGRRDPRNESMDQKYQPAHDDNERRVRSGSRDSRSSRNNSQDSRGRQPSRGNMQSPHSDRNSSLERRKGQERIKQDDRTQNYERRTHRSLERSDTGNRSELERMRSIKHSEEQRPSRPGSSQSSQDRKRVKEDRKPQSSTLKRKPKEARTSSKRTGEKSKEGDRALKKSKEPKKAADISDVELNELIKEESKDETPSEVDWNELPASVPDETDNVKEHSSVLSKFSPANILRNTGIIMDMLPPHLIEKINKLETENAKKDESKTESASKRFVTGMLRNGLNAYSDERLRKRLLGYNMDYPHPLYPPVIINAKTYSASLKEYMRKTRMVEAV